MKINKCAYCGEEIKTNLVLNCCCGSFCSIEHLHAYHNQKVENKGVNAGEMSKSVPSRNKKSMYVDNPSDEALK